MEAISQMTMKVQFDRGDFNNMAKLKEVTTPILLNAPVDHLALYPGLWESSLRSRIEYWRVDYIRYSRGMQRPSEIMIPMRVTIGAGKKEMKGWLVAHIMAESKEIKFSIPKADMRRETSFFQRLGQELWEMARIYYLPKLKGGLKRTQINDGITDSEKDEDGFMTAAIMWQRAVNGVGGLKISTETSTMEKKAIMMMMAYLG